MKDKFFIIKILLIVLLVCIFIFMKSMSKTSIIHPNSLEEYVPTQSNKTEDLNNTTEIASNNQTNEEQNEPIEETIEDAEVLDWGIINLEGTPRLWAKVRSNSSITTDLSLDIDLYNNEEIVFSTLAENSTLYIPAILPYYEAILYTDFNVPDVQDCEAKFSQRVRKVKGYDNTVVALGKSNKDENTIHFDIVTLETQYKSIWADILCYKEGKVVNFISKRLRPDQALNDVTAESDKDFDDYDIVVNIFK